MTEFKVGDELRGKRFREYRGVVMRVDGEDVTFRNRLGDLIVSTQSRLLRDFVVLPVECTTSKGAVRGAHARRATT